MKVDFQIVGAGIVLDGGSLLLETDKGTFFKIPRDGKRGVKPGVILTSTTTKGMYVEAPNQDELAVLLEFMLRQYKDAYYYSWFIKHIKMNRQLSKETQNKLFAPTLKDEDGNVIQYVDGGNNEKFFELYLSLHQGL